MKRFPRGQRRRGLALVPALVCLVLTTLLCASLVRVAHTQRGLVRSSEQALQADWLAESGLARASARLAADRKYEGERWEVPAGDLGGLPGLVVIAVKPAAGGRVVRVTADYPAGAVERRHRRTKTLTLDLGPETP